jgi:hypothetical protein
LHRATTGIPAFSPSAIGLVITPEKKRRKKNQSAFFKNVITFGTIQIGKNQIKSL